jgi:hypothetical protein
MCRAGKLLRSESCPGRRAESERSSGVGQGKMDRLSRWRSSQKGQGLASGEQNGIGVVGVE